MADVEKKHNSDDEVSDAGNATLGHAQDPAAAEVAQAPLAKTESKRDEAIADPGNVRQVRGWRWAVACVLVCLSAFLYGLDTTIAANIQGPAIATFGQVDKLAWIGTGFPLGSIAIILSVGKAYGIFNMKHLYIVSMIMFEAGSALCGGAPNMSALIVGRVWAGMGGAGIYLGGLNVISVFTTIRERSMYIGLLSISWGIGTILGPVIGGAFADSSATWRWAFYINLVIFGVSAPAILLYLPSFDPRPDLTFWQKLRHVDWLGSFLNAVIYTLFVIALTFGGAQWRWSSPGFIVCIVLCGVAIIAFGVQQKFLILTKKDWRIFPIDFVGNPQLVLHYVLTSTFSTAAFVTLYYVPIYFQFAQGDNGITTAVRLLPFICMFIFFCLFNGTLMPVLGVYMPWYVAGEVFILIGSALMYAIVNLHTSTSAIYGFTVLIGIGTGLAVQASYSVVPAKVDPVRVPDAIGFINSAQIGSIVISLSISGTVFQNIGYQHVSKVLQGMNFTPGDIHAALSGTQSRVFTNTSPEVREQVLEGIVKAINDNYILVMAASALGLICSLLLKREKLFMKMEAGG